MIKQALYTFDKQSDFIDTIKPLVKPLAIVGGMLGSHYLIDKIVHVGNDALKASMTDLIKKDKKIDTSAVMQKAKEMAGISYVPHSILKGYNNAAYIPAGSIPEHMAKGLMTKSKDYLMSKDKKKKAMGNFILKSIKYSQNPKGGIIIGDKFDNPAVASHEIGHAIINERGGFDKLVQGYYSTLKKIGAPASIAGLLTKMVNPDLGDYIFWGGVGTYGLGTLGQIYTEYTASKYAKEIMEQQHIGSPKRNSILNRALGTYALKNVGENVKNITMGLIPKFF
jgi:hypothetical protein